MVAYRFNMEYFKSDDNDIMGDKSLYYIYIHDIIDNMSLTNCSSVCLNMVAFRGEIYY